MGLVLGSGMTAVRLAGRVAGVPRAPRVAGELTVRESMIFLDGREFTGEPPGLRTVQRGPLMLVYLTDARGERVVILQVNWIG